MDLAEFASLDGLDSSSVEIIDLTSDPPQDMSTDSIALAREIYSPTSYDLSKEVLERKQRRQKKKFQSIWEKIINTYESIPEDDQGDIIDLKTGEIIEDKGHLRSLKPKPPGENIWGMYYNLEQDRTKEPKRVLPPPRPPTYTQQGLSFSLSPSKNKKPLNLYEDDLLLLGANPDLAAKISFTQSLLDPELESSPLKDNLQLVSPSKTNGSNLTPRRSRRTSPFKHEARSARQNSNSPIAAHNLSPSLDRIRKIDSSSIISDNSHLPLVDSTRSPSDNGDSDDIKRGHSHKSPFLSDKRRRLFVLENSYSDLEEVKASMDTSVTSSINDESSMVDSELEHSSIEIISMSNSISERDGEDESDLEAKDSTKDVSRDSISSTGSMLYRGGRSCPFPSCEKSYNSDRNYKLHLEDEHSHKLLEYGYPVSEDIFIEKKRNKDIGEIDNSSIIDQLAEDFPLVLEVPPLPEGRVYKCRQANCNKWFLRASYLMRHITSGQCSTEKAMLVCPMLGCSFESSDYMTFRDHFVSFRHHIHPDVREKYVDHDFHSFEIDINRSISKDEEDPLLQRSTMLESTPDPSRKLGILESLSTYWDSDGGVDDDNDGL